MLTFVFVIVRLLVSVRMAFLVMVMGMAIQTLMLVIVGVIDGGPFPDDVELRCADTRARDAFAPHGVWGNRKAPQGAPHLVERQARVDERAEQHVAGSA
jgi:hypothetical protein